VFSVLPLPPSTIYAGRIALEPASRRVSIDGEALSLTTVEYEIAALLVRSAGRIVSRETMIRSVFSREPSPFDRALDVHVSHLRSKLGDRSLIVTVRGVGHLLRI
jgi:two-component system, OmpR family, response regulator CpxR